MKIKNDKDREELKAFWREMYMEVPKEELIEKFIIAQEALELSIILHAKTMQMIVSQETYLCPECKSRHKATHKSKKNGS